MALRLADAIRNELTKMSSGEIPIVEGIRGAMKGALRLSSTSELSSEHFDDKIRPALMVEHPDMTKQGVEVFRRKWEVSCKVF